MQYLNRPEIMSWISLPGLLLVDHHAQDRYRSKKYHKDNSNIKDQAFYAASGLEDRAGATAAEDAA